MSVVTNKILRTFLFTLGFFSLVLGLIGIFLPLLPTTPFLLLATWCFFKSSPAYYKWLYRHPYMGKVIRDWQERGTISRKSKVLALMLILFSLVIIWLRDIYSPVQYIVTFLLFFVSIFIATRPS